MKHTKNVIIIILALLLLTSVYFNFQKYSPPPEQKSSDDQSSQLTSEDIFKKKQDCEKYRPQVEKKLEADYFENPTTGLQASHYLQKIFYSTKLNTCLYVALEREFVHGKPTFETPILVDALSGELLLSGLRELGSTDYLQAKQSFEDNLKAYE